MLEDVILVGAGRGAAPGLDGHEGALGAVFRRSRTPDAHVVEGWEVDAHAVARGAHHLERVIGHAGEHDGILGEEPVGEREPVRVLEERRQALVVEKAAVGDDGARLRPGPREPELVVLEPLARHHRHVEGRMPAQEEGHLARAGVGDREGLGKRGRALERVGHLEAEGVGVLGERLVGAVEAIRHGAAGVLDELVVVVAREAVAAQVAGAGRGACLVVPDGTHDGEEDGRMLAPPARVRLPEVLAAVEREARELGAVGVDLGREGACRDCREVCHVCSLSARMAGRAPRPAAMHRAPPVHVQILASLAARAALPLLAWSRCPGLAVERAHNRLW